MPSRISVIIPVHNRPNGLSEAVHSLLSTCYPNLEILIIDDGSTDDTFSRARELGAQNPSVVRVLRHGDGGNHGPGASRNLGVRISTGDYVGFLDSDDVVLTNRFDSAVQLLDQDETIGAVFEPCAWEGEEEPQRSSKSDENSRLDPGGRWNTNSILFRKSCFLELGGFSEDLRTCEDFVLWAKLRLAARLVEGGSEPVAVYRRYQGNTPVILENSLAARLEVAHWASKRRLNSEKAGLLKENVWGKTLFVCDRLREEGRPGKAFRMLVLSASAHPSFVLRPRFWRNVAGAILRR